MANTLAVSDATFGTEVEQEEGLTVIDFWAPWCAPCRMVSPLVDELAREYRGRARVAKLNIDENPVTASRFNVRSIPTILFLKGGKVVDTVAGAVPKPLLASKIEQHPGAPLVRSRPGGVRAPRDRHPARGGRRMCDLLMHRLAAPVGV